MDGACRRFVITGQVQGVFFRASAQRQAQALRLTGWARNLSTGQVEVLACGAEDQLDAMQAWLWTGPPQARVTDVAWTAVEARHGNGFEIL